MQEQLQWPVIPVTIHGAYELFPLTWNVNQCGKVGPQSKRFRVVTPPVVEKWKHTCRLCFLHLCESHHMPSMWPSPHHHHHQPSYLLRAKQGADRPRVEGIAVCAGMNCFVALAGVYCIRVRKKGLLCLYYRVPFVLASVLLLVVLPLGLPREVSC